MTENSLQHLLDSSGDIVTLLRIKPGCRQNQQDKAAADEAKEAAAAHLVRGAALHRGGSLRLVELRTWFVPVFDVISAHANSLRNPLCAPLRQDPDGSEHTGFPHARRLPCDEPRPASVERRPFGVQVSSRSRRCVPSGASAPSHGAPQPGLPGSVSTQMSNRTRLEGVI